MTVTTIVATGCSKGRVEVDQQALVVAARDEMRRAGRLALRHVARLAEEQSGSAH